MELAAIQLLNALGAAGTKTRLKIMVNNSSKEERKETIEKALERFEKEFVSHVSLYKAAEKNGWVDGTPKEVKAFLISELQNAYDLGVKDTEERIRKWVENEKNQKYTEGGDEAVIVDDLLTFLKK
jgi:hypothetical protein